ncbi:hypothetical protein [Paraburkholderia pallida]|uniref:Uncharacterized protein n=1 Tax=Paraburkholderia pallida TaxID=2547399 RepID=A0A4P7CPY0_9BURK|nr:hypothetical protein [Paraburkholderia pallida]QBQ97898.1 hypothetical protein E1956_12405 [Paraburkholderia pallida]
MTEPTSFRFTITGIGRDTTHWRSLVLLQGADGSSQYVPLAELLERAEQISGLDWLQSEIQEQRVRLCEADAEIWARWIADLHREACHA